MRFQWNRHAKGFGRLHQRLRCPRGAAMSDILKAIGALFLLIFIFWILPGCVSVTIELDRKDNKTLYENYVPDETEYAIDEWEV